MNSKHDRGPAGRNGHRIGLLFLAVTAIGTGLWAYFVPQSFTRTFPCPAGTGSPL